MLHRQVVTLPIVFQVDEGILSNIEGYLERNSLFFNRVLILSGSTYSLDIANKIMAKKHGIDRHIIESNDSSCVERVKNMCLEGRYELLLAVGGGKVLDVAKRVSYLASINNICVPTIISNDGLISPIAVIRNDSGRSDSLPAMMPMGVIIDLDIIRHSPIKYLAAAAGDILSNLSATNDWTTAHLKEKEGINDLSYHLSRGASLSLVQSISTDLKDKAFLRLLILAQINSGISMALAGTSRPCSGSEHLISHAMDFLNLTKGVLHGEQVASASLFTLHLQRKLDGSHLKYAREIGINLLFTDYLIDGELYLIKLFETARNMRPGRVTVLDNFSNNDLINEFKVFKKLLRAY